MRHFKKKGEVYIGVLISIGIFVMLSQAVVFLASTGYELIGFTRARSVARELASQKMEIIRNLSYDSIGTVDGIPNGIIPQSEIVQLNGQKYIVNTEILYVDDTFDGISPDDLVPNDYKSARVDVSWAGFGTRTVTTTLVSSIAPKGIEEITGGGTLSFLVFDSNGSPVSNANISVVSSGITPAVNLNVVSNNNGRIVIPGAGTCVKCYRVTATKSGYSTDRTYGTNEVANPAKPDLTVTTGGLTEMSFTIDHTATLVLNSLNSRVNNFSVLPSITLKVQGSKTIGTDTLDNLVYKYDKYVTTDGSGSLTLNNMEWDTYLVQTATASAYTIGGTNPLAPFNLSPESSITEKVVLPSKTANSLLVAFLDPALTPIASVSATLKDGNTVIATASAGLNSDPDFGHVFFSNLDAKIYTVDASASGYQSTTTTVSVSGEKYQPITLNP